jgi:2-oxoglutarate/2-oxoacid ferredoxin oxidoreductase subunit alpha
MRYSWKIGGPAGYGIKSAGAIFTKAFLKKGLNVFYYSEYPSLIRGGHNTVQVDISDDKVRSSSEKISFLVALDDLTIKIDKQYLRKDGILIYDENTILNKKNLPKEGVYGIPLSDIAKESGDLLLRNTVALGASFAFFGCRLKELEKAIELTFKKKGDEVIKQNIEAAKIGYDYAKKTFLLDPVEFFDVVRPSKNKKIMTGNEATAIGAVVGGLKFYAAYPMTPATAILHYLAKYQRDCDLVVHQGEDEIGVIHEALGASFAGARSMIGTSGGGFALMGEGFSLSGMTETPLVIAEVMRPSPASGLPTWTDQGDLSFVVNSGHGDFPRAVLAPGDPVEAYELTQEALNIAERYQMPVVLLSDKFLGESKYTISSERLKEIKLKIDRGEIVTKINKEYKRYSNMRSGISPRVFPGTEGGEHIANSDEHNSYGFSVEGFDKDRAIQMNKRQRKVVALKKEMKLPKIFGPKNADISFVSWGSNKGPILDALESVDYKIGKGKQPVNYIHFTHIYPLPLGVGKILKQANRLILVECNQSAQFGKLLAQEFGIKIKEKILKYDSRPFWPEEITQYFNINKIDKTLKSLWKKNDN